MFYKIIIYILFCTTLLAESLPPASLSNAVDRFQNAVQQQTFESVLMSIEERLRNLDNIYSMQLSETIKSKLDQYHRKLESLDLKIIRLESMVMLNLDKISENISTKNYKDDATVTQTLRKLDNMYDRLSHRINYMDRKSDMAYEKIQNKIDTTLLRIEKMEENMVQKYSDMEAELSESFFIIDDFKSSSASTEQSLLNITNFLNENISNGPIINSINSSIQNLLKELNYSVTQRLEKLENTTMKNLNVSERSKGILNSMKIEVKGDFNEYANKVADMNADIWKRTDVAHESLKTIESMTNLTRIEVQNGIRALMLQIGKLSGKGIPNNDKTSLESLKKSVNLSLEKIITNQELFLESCHRVQMDESQIESEISVMLEKLIDMLQNKMTTLMKDFKGLEKTVKNHDSRTLRNLNQANTNIVSLFEKTTKSNEFAKKELDEIKFYINSLFTFVQDVLPKSSGSNGTNQYTEGHLNELLVNVTNLMNSAKIYNDIKWIQLEKNFTKQIIITKEVNNQIKSIADVLTKSELSNPTALSDHTDRFLNDIRQLIIDLNNITEVPKSIKKPVTEIKDTDDIKRDKCPQNYLDLIEVRHGGTPCNENTEIKSKDKKINLIHTKEEINQSTTPKPEDDNQLKKSIFDLFGTPPPAIVSTTKTPLNKTTVKSTSKKRKCIPAWADLINVRFDSNENMKKCSPVLKKYKGKSKTQSRFDDETVEYEDDDDDYSEGSTENSSTTESDMSSTEISTTEHLQQVDNIM